MERALSKTKLQKLVSSNLMFGRDKDALKKAISDHRTRALLAPLVAERFEETLSQGMVSDFLKLYDVVAPHADLTRTLPDILQKTTKSLILQGKINEFIGIVEALEQRNVPLKKVIQQAQENVFNAGQEMPSYGDIAKVI